MTHRSVHRTLHRPRTGGATAVLIGLVVLLVAGAAVWWFLIRKPNTDPDKDGPGTHASASSLDLVPTDVPVFGTIALAGWWNSEQGKKLQQQIAELEPSTKIEAAVGLPPEKIARLTAYLAKNKALVIVASTTPCDQKHILGLIAQGAKEAKVGDKVYHVDGGQRAVHFADDKVYVFGPAPLVKDFLEHPAKASIRGEGALKEAAGLAEKHLIVAAVNAQFEPLQKELQNGAPPPFDKAMKPLTDLKVASLALDLDEDLNLVSVLTYPDADTAKKSQPAVKDTLEVARVLLGQFRKSTPPANKEAVAPFFNFLDSILLSATAEQQDANVTVQLKSEKGTLGQLIAALGPAVQKVREAAQRTVALNNLKQIGLAMHIYHDTFGRFPTAAIYDKTKQKPLLSWRVAILPYIEQQALYQQFHLDEPWDSEHNKKLLDKMPKVYASLGSGKSPADSTVLRVFTGPMTAFKGATPTRISGITDGTSQTIMVVEAADAVPWTKPDELVYDPQKPLPKLGGMFKGVILMGMFDGSVRSVSDKISEKTLRAAITANGNEVLGSDW
jgi:hypothetical protein